ncbi:uncharacterized protein LOC124368385 isoform X2 [Homalodisca vitripennis]|nr:uncharacterized protein LOC124368385 isoform X2 [Homalodisca vitripennis]XP_046681637.1 uncharacterized protein LOC124368385 isoform X2 [Homalodisca vitripennis]
MHFWIDKRSQTCGFSGRHRVPSSLGGSGRRWRGVKPMVTPVHRFQAVECVAGQYAHSHMRRPARHNCLPQPTYRLDGLGVSTELPVRAHAVELDSSVFLDLPLDNTEDQTHVVLPELEPVGRLKCGMWTSFALATGLIVAAKFYFNNQETALEVLIFAALMIVFLLAGCTISLCRSKATRDLLSAAVTASAAYGPAPPTLTVVPPPPEEPPQAPPPLTEPPPPPYHIAILLPQQISAEEVPPPSYDKAVS